MENKYLSLAQAAQMAPANPSPNTVWRWCRKGVKSRAGHRVHLVHVRVGGKLFVEQPALDQFFKALSDADAEYFADEEVSPEIPSPPKSRSAARREKAIDKAKSELAADGV